jgi:alpha-galactosidase
VEIYRRALLEYGLDGFKLDFIDSFTLNTDHSLREDPRRDIPSLEDAVNRLLTDVMAALRAIRPDILIEFRQSYVGPAIRKYGNMLRAADCPNDPYHNRLSCTDLRLPSGKTAVHSDMIMWHKDEPVERAAHQVLATLFAVNQISVKLEEQSPEHLAMLRHLLTFMREHRETLLDAPFYADSPANNYTVSYAQGKGEFIAADYAGVPVSVGEGHAYVFAAAGRRETVLRLPQNAAGRTYRVVDCMGNTLEEGQLDGAAFRSFAAPMGGMIEIL